MHMHISQMLKITWSNTCKRICFQAADINQAQEKRGHFGLSCLSSTTSMERSPLLENRLVNDFRTSCEIWKSISLFTAANHLPLLSARSFHSKLSQLISLTFILTLPFLLRLRLPISFFPSYIPSKTLYASLHHTFHVPCKFYSSWFGHPNSIRWEVQIMHLHTIQFPPLPCYPIPLRSKYLHQQTILEHLGLCSYLSTRDHVSHPYQRTVKNAVLFILILIILVGICEEKGYWSER